MGVGLGLRTETGTIAVPEPGTGSSAPGAREVEVSALTLSDHVTGPGPPVILSALIRGQNIGHIKLFVGYCDRESNSIFVADMDYLESAETGEIDRVYHPGWGEQGEFTLEFEWEPLMFAIADDVDSIVALFTPQEYAVSPQEAT